MPKTLTSYALILRPPPGARFSFTQTGPLFTGDIELQGPIGKEQEAIDWLRNWLDAYVQPFVPKEVTPDETPTVEEAKPQAMCGQQHAVEDNIFACTLHEGHHGYHAVVLHHDDGKIEMVAGWPQGDNTHVEEE